MGMEYKITFDYPNSSILEAFVKNLENVELVSSPNSGFDFRIPTTSKAEMPDAHFEIQKSGLYFVWNGIKGRDFMDNLLSQLGSQFGTVQIEEL